ncbi:MAG: protein translocase subunit SecD [Candidatus Kapaibacteriales bacterium]
MKNLGKYLLLAIPLIVAITVLLPTYQYNSLEAEEEEALARASAPENTPADSLAIMEAFYLENREALESSKEGRLKLGLDRRGGMYVTLEVDIVRLIEDMIYPEYRNEPLMRSILDATAEEAEESEESIIDIFISKFNELAKPEGKSLVTYFNMAGQDEYSDETVIEQLKRNESDAIDQAQQVIRQRIDKYGVAEPNIQKSGNKRIIIELPGVNDEGQIRELLKATAKLEFRVVRYEQEDYEFFAEIDKMLLASGDSPAEPTPLEDTDEAVEEESESTEDEVAEENAIDTTDIANNDVVDSAATDSEDATEADSLSQEARRDQELAKRPFTRLFYQQPYQNSSGQTVVAFYVVKDSLPRLQEILRRPEIAALVPSDSEILYGQPQGEGKQTTYPMYVVGADADLTGESLVDAYKYFDPTQNEWVVSMKMDDEGAETWAALTGANVGRQIAIVLDSLVYSAPNVVDRITGGSSQISGNIGAEEAKLLEIVLKAGSLKAPVKIIEERVVGASLGDDSIESGLIASAIAFVLVVLFMIVYYSKGGIIADVAVVLNVTLIITFLAIIQGTLTLPGIAGIILTIGMAVDANVLIFERIREELAKGRSMRAAIDEGYSKALSAILDSNITTFITALILYYQGSGVIQGFALTLIFGIFATLFTAIIVTRAMVELSLNGPDARFSFGQAKS